MVLAALAGAALGCGGGVALGIALVEKYFPHHPKDYLNSVDISADDNDDIPMPQTGGKSVSFFKKRLLQDTSPWLIQPDYDRLLFINTILQILWPHLSPAIHKTVMEAAKEPLEQACKQAKILETIRIDRLDLGTRPPRIDCFKSFDTNEDELIIETPAFWGGDMSLRVTAVIKAGSRTIDLPVDIKNIQFKALTRVTIKPLVETLPCFGGVTVSLMETPHFNFDLRIADGYDLMALPFVPSLVGLAIKLVAGQMMVYPNEYSLPLMPNFGLPPPPQGMLHVKVVGAKGLKGSLLDRMDPFVELELREKRTVHTTTLSNNENPVWNEEFDFVVDDPKQQGLKLCVKDDDLVSASVEGVAVVPLETAEFMRNPRQTLTLTIPLHAPGATGKSKNRPGGENESPGGAAAAAGAGAAVAGGSSEKKKGWLASHVPKLRRKKKSLTPEPDAMGTPRSDLHELESPGRRISQDSVSVALEEDRADDAASEAGTPRVALPAGALTGATLTIECTYYPFKSAQPEVVKPPAGTEEAGATATPAATMVTSIRRTLLSTGHSRHDLANTKGVLTVTLKKAANLEGSPDTYATVSLYDPHRKPIPNIDYATDMVINENNPRYNFKTDFVNVSAASSLNIVIYEKAGALEALTSKVPFLSSKDKNKMIGRVRVPVEAAVQEGRLKDRLPLLEAQTGEVHVTMEWNPVSLEEDDEEDEDAGSTSG